MPSTTSPGSTRVPSISSSRRTTPTTVPQKSSWSVPVDAGQLGRLTAEDRATGRPAHLGRTLDQLCDLLRIDRVGGDVVEEEERVARRS